MKKTLKIIFLTSLITIGLSSCDFMNYKDKQQNQSDSNVNEWNEAYHPNLIPMYGEAQKTKEAISADKYYVDEMLKIHGNKYKAAKNTARDGWYYFFHEKMDTAMYRFNQCWLIDSSYAESYFGFAAIKEFQGHKNEAEKYYQRAYNTDISDTISKHCLLTIADIKEKQKDTLGLLNSYFRLFNKFPNDKTATGKLGFFYSTINKPDSALKYYNLTIELDSEYEQTYLNRGWLYYQEGQLNLAIADYTTVIEKNKQSIYGYVNRSIVLIEDKQYELAIKDINSSIELEPKYPDFHFTKAECYHHLNQDKKACDEIKIGIKKGGNYTDKIKGYKCE
jgi:tetratricopeptide (TPR) repeat protein